MSSLVLHPQTREQIAHYLLLPSHALILTGSRGIGKEHVAFYILSELLRVSDDKIRDFPQSLVIEPVKQSITIDQIRSITQHVKLKTTGVQQYRRFILLLEADAVTNEAQNALLKILEEPPSDTVMILTVSNEQRMRPTILSRSQKITVYPPSSKVLISALQQAHPDIDPQLITQQVLLSGSLPGLSTALITENDAHPLREALVEAKNLLQQDTFQRLTMVDRIAKDKELCQSIAFALQQIAQSGLSRSAISDKIGELQRWRSVLTAVQDYQDSMRVNAQNKLALITLMLSI